MGERRRRRKLEGHASPGENLVTPKCSSVVQMLHESDMMAPNAHTVLIASVTGSELLSEPIRKTNKYKLLVQFVIRIFVGIAKHS